ncbi:MAG TPA: hypothetical protein VIY08_13115 [Candidatus Nitrosocosmicus sp.]
MVDNVVTKRPPPYKTKTRGRGRGRKLQHLCLEKHIILNLKNK